MHAGPDPAATMSSKRAKGKTTKKRPQRATSNVFAMFDQSQIQEFKEAFNMIDQNRDGFIDKEDLHDMLASLGTCREKCCHYRSIRICCWVILTLLGCQDIESRSRSLFDWNLKILHVSVCSLMHQAELESKAVFSPQVRTLLMSTSRG